jgi:hypothetical protein
MTLPADEDSAERNHAGLSEEMLDDNPIGGELHDLITPKTSGLRQAKGFSISQTA